ncbi:MAG: hypothetical protein HQK88_14685 [Nitrospirae bacterium]|nr:hypothetical protein [Nitrospirota bacterium]MBF0521271.1 hypothetical protein [Nitrospirota bacterium]MBF0533917.1 hypothetical protein [Nitrospirota bacterium]MBF0618045.1 hypothetical protein [Nitrospirota bacterium]
MSKQQFDCKHCKSPFIADLADIRSKRRGIAVRGFGIDNSKAPVDLKCPHCSKSASYTEADGKEVNANV